MPPKLRGTYTALVTPMNRDGSLDLAALDNLVDAQIAGGVEGLVPCGTTGEAVTLSAQERFTVIERVAKRASGKSTIIAGTGTNNTAESIEFQKRARDLGVHFGLVVTPYYNKPTPEGLFRHYEAITSKTELPIVLYNVPSRTGCDMKPETIARIAKLPGVVGVKEASADLDRVYQIQRSTPESFAILSGDDGTTFPFVCMGGHGVISVVSNVTPRDMSDMVRSALADDVTKARAQHNKLRDLITGLFWESNPIPAKAALAMMKQMQPFLRLPLVEMSPEPRERLATVLRAGGWIS